ncbi:hypothetical protein Pmani_001310 [Petrolisthes manimaculis]|uniref:CCHC-type domain-containing protein n=1 Tax=Petrolisthes manimaculis TaxID=1843537 RepID=A0AAE1QKT6_9EUCA|nr:hypothetical protein Pmani_001310 [Petrolisthes manimaculis]
MECGRALRCRPPAGALMWRGTRRRQEAIRDAFVSDIGSPAIRQRLLEKTTLTLQEAVQLAISLESAQRNAEMYLTPIQPGYASSATEKAFSPVSDSPGVISTYDSVRQPTSDTTASATRIVCYFCGNSKHPRVRCPARNVYYLKCGKKGHFAKVCKTVESAKQCNSTSTDFIAAASHTRDSSGYNVAEPNRRAREMEPAQSVTDPPHHAKIDVRINNVNMTALIDSGSTSSFLHPCVIKQLGIPVAQFQENIILASRDVSTTLGHCIVDLKVQNNKYPHYKFSVLPELCAKVILGEDFMRMHKLVEFDFDGSRPKLTVCGVATMFVDPPSLFPSLTEDCKPVSTPNRRFSKFDEDFIKDEIRSLLENGIINESQSPWRAQVLVTKDERHKRHMVVDYSRTVNRFTQLDAYPFPRIHELSVTGLQTVNT